MTGFKKSSFMEDGRAISCWIGEDFRDPAFVGFIRDVEIHLSAAKIVKDSRSVKAGTCRFRDMPIFVKRYNDRGLVHRIRYMLKRPRALNALRIFSHLKSCAPGLRIPRHLAAICVADAGKRISYLLQEAVTNLLATQKVCEHALSTEDAKRRLIDELTATLSRLHASGVLHGDAKLTNFLFSGGLESHVCGVWDFDVARISERIPLHVRERELARTAASFLDITRKINKNISKNETLELFSTGYEKSSGMRPGFKRLSGWTDHFAG